jgi:predicted TIM-barrel fold metal-dependent hydrolase
MPKRKIVDAHHHLWNLGAGYPVDKLYSSFDSLYSAFETVVASFTEGEKDKLFHRNALRIYRILAASE